MAAVAVESVADCSLGSLDPRLAEEHAVMLAATNITDNSSVQIFFILITYVGLSGAKITIFSQKTIEMCINEIRYLLKIDSKHRILNKIYAKKRLNCGIYSLL